MEHDNHMVDAVMYKIKAALPEKASKQLEIKSNHPLMLMVSVDTSVCVWGGGGGFEGLWGETTVVGGVLRDLIIGVRKCGIVETWGAGWRVMTGGTGKSIRGFDPREGEKVLFCEGKARDVG